MKILVIDDELSVREAYHHALSPPEWKRTSDAFDSLTQELFGGERSSEATQMLHEALFEIHFASQGLDAVSMIGEALSRGDPFKVAFIDVRMPPGIDGRETARRIRSIDPDINLVIVTAYSDHSVIDIADVAGPPDKIFYISKPFSGEEIHQMALALCRRWDHDTGQMELLRQKIAELAISEARAKHAASHDFLTGAPNRLAFQQELSRLLSEPGCNFALAFVDLDRFKHVNDTFGHGAGDDLLNTIYDRLRRNVPDYVMVARVGGDEFGLIIPTSAGCNPQQLCEHLVETCSGSFAVFGNSIRIGMSCGLLIPEQQVYRDVVELMRFADLALFAAKRSGRGRVCIFDTVMDESQRFRQAIETGLRKAIANNELALHYQPIVERESLTAVGFEALLRWFSPEHGSISPAVFIPIAEESNLIEELGEWVVSQALADSRDWPELFVSINFSPRQFKRADFPDWLDAHVAKWRTSPSRIQIEVTETAIFENSERAADILGEVQNRGYRIALDDFGTGYSSLFNIKNFSLNCIKIDKSFIDGLGNDKHCSAIVSSIVHLAQELGLSIIAEGVETHTQCQMLQATGCSHFQGYFFGKAQPALEAARMARDNQRKQTVDGRPRRLATGQLR